MSPLRVSAALTLTAALALVPAGTASAAAPAPQTVPLQEGSQPEGIAAGGDGTFYAGARSDGAIYAGDVRTGERRLLAAGSPGAAARGMQLAWGSRLLWVAGDVRDPDGGESTTSTVTAYDTRTGEQVQRIVVPGQRFLNDVQVTRDAVYVTDSLSNELVVVRGGTFTLLPMTGDYPATTTGFGANGIRLLPTGDLVVVNSSTGDLYRVDPATGVADRIELTGPDLTSGDGLALRGTTLYVVYGFGRDGIATVRLAEDGRSGAVGRELVDDDLDRPTTAVRIGNALYAVNGRFQVPPTPTTPYDVVRVALR